MVYDASHCAQVPDVVVGDLPLFYCHLPYLRSPFYYLGRLSSPLRRGSRCSRRRFLNGYSLWVGRSGAILSYSSGPISFLPSSGLCWEGRAVSLVPVALLFRLEHRVGYRGGRFRRFHLPPSFVYECALIRWRLVTFFVDIPPNYRLSFNTFLTSLLSSCRSLSNWGVLQMRPLLHMAMAMAQTVCIRWLVRNPASIPTLSWRRRKSWYSATPHTKWHSLLLRMPGRSPLMSPSLF